MLAGAVRQFKKGDFPKFSEFVQQQFHEKYILSDENFFEWQYRSNPYLDDYAFFLLEQGGSMYGYIGMVPLDYSVGGKIAKINMYANLFVDQRARSLGLGTLLIKRAMELSGAAMISGYNPKSFSIYEKLGDWKELGNFHRYARVINAGAVESLLPQGAPRSGAIPVAPHPDQSFQPLESIRLFDESFDMFWKQARARYGATVERTKEFMNWRYARHPHLNYEIRVAKGDGRIIGCLVYRIERAGSFSIARIIDCVSEAGVELGILGAFVAETADHVDMMDFMFSGDYCREALEQLGFFDIYGTPFSGLPMYFNPVSYAKNYINFCAWPGSAAVDKEAFYNHNNWYLTKGDGDQDRPNPH